MLFFIRYCIVILNLVLSCFVSIIVYSQTNSRGFVLEGELIGKRDGNIYLSYFSENEKKRFDDSCKVKDGKFTFKGDIKNPAVAFISLIKGRAFDPNATNIFLEPNRMYLIIKKDSFSLARLTGSKTHKDYDSLQKRKSHFLRVYEEIISGTMDNRSKNENANKQETLNIIMDSISRIDYNFFRSNPTSYLTAYLLQSYVGRLSVDSLVFYYSRLGDNLKQHVITKNIRDKIGKLRNGSIGSIASSFASVDANGDYVLSRFFRGKYILLNFWASWCVPCRKENPELNGLYEMYKGKGLKVIGIADNDKDTLSWKKAIKEDNIESWVHLLRSANHEAKMSGAKDNSDLFEKFGVAGLPTLVLINSNGIIISRYFDEKDRIEKLSVKLKEVFDK